MTMPFIDSNVLLYLLSKEDRKAAISRVLVREGGCISVQVLNEVANVMRKKGRCDWEEIDELQSLLRALLTVKSVTPESQVLGVKLSRQYGFSIYDGQIVAVALLNGGGLLYSEDMQHGLLVHKSLRIENPFQP